MKAIKTILATLLCLSLVLSFAVIGTFAEEATGSITIQDQSGTNATVSGKTFRLFRIFNVEKADGNTAYDWIVKDGVNLYESFFYGDTVTDAESVKHVFPNLITPTEPTKAHSINDVVAYIESLRGNAYELSQMATDLHTYIHAKGLATFDGYVTTTDPVGEGQTSYTFSDLELGYYMIYDVTEFTGEGPAVRSAAMLAHSGENVIIELKADRPTVNKYVDDDKTDGVIDDMGATSSIGETIDFRIVTKIPDHKMYGENYTFVISDVMADGLELSGSLNVTLTKKDGSTVPVTNENVKIETTNLDDGVDFKVTLLDATEIDAGTVVEITYQATVLSSAKKVNVNTVTLTYSNDPNVPNSVGKVSSEVSVMLWDGVITKLKEGSNQRLGGAEFQIFKKVDDVVSSEPLTFTFDADSEKYIYDPDSGTSTLKTVNNAESTNFGQILLFGLGEGTYVLRETEAPTGYIQADGDFEFILVDAINTDGSISAMNTSISISRENDIAGQFVDVRVRPYEDNGTLAMVYHLGITNRPGQALPETGGMGTAIFTVLGVVLMVGAVAFFASRKRSSAA